MTVGENTGSGLGTYTASLEPYREITLASQVAGYVGSVKQVMGADGRLRAIQGGDRVKTGELLAAIKSDTYEAQVARAESALTAAQASYARAKRDFDRDSVLIKQQVIAQATYDQASQEYQTALAQVNQSRAELNQARVTLGYCSLTSAIDGVLLDRRIEVGSLVEPNSPAFTVADTDEMKAVFGVSDIELAHLKQGAVQALTTDALPGVPLSGTITEISPTADPATRTFAVEITVPNKDGRLRSGMIASLQLANSNAPTATALTLPINAIVRAPGDPSDFAIYVAQDRGDRTLARLRKVNLGEIVGNQIAVTKGVAPGDRVIVRGAMIVTEGSEVRIIP